MDEDALRRLYPQYSIEDLQTYLSKFQLGWGLVSLAQVSANLWEQGQVYRYIGGQAFSEWQIGFLAQELIRVSSDLAPLRLDQGNAAVRAMELANGLRDYFQLHDEGTPEDRHEIRLSFFLRLASEQFWTQVNRWYLIPRHLSLYQILAQTKRKIGEPDLAAEFRDAYDLTILDFIKIGFTALTLVSAAKKPNFVTENLTSRHLRAMRSVLTRKNVKAFLATASLSIEEFREKLIEGGSPPAGLEKHWLNPLWRYPLVRTSMGYVVPSVSLLLQRITSGIYFGFLDRRLGERSAIQHFTSFFGRVFEAHVGEELACEFEQDELLPEQPYFGGAWRGPDWTIVEGKRATLIECKTSRLTKVERERADIPLIRERLRQDIIPAIQLLPEKSEHIRRRVHGLQHWPEIDDFEFVIVTLDPWWPEIVVRKLIDEELRGTPAEGLRYHLMWIEQLEYLGSYRERTAIFDLLRRRWQCDPEWDMRKYLHEEAKRLGVRPISPRMEQIAQDFWSQIMPNGDTSGRELGGGN